MPATWKSRGQLVDYNRAFGGVAALRRALGTGQNVAQVFAGVPQAESTDTDSPRASSKLDGFAHVPKMVSRCCDLARNEPQRPRFGVDREHEPRGTGVAD